MSHDILFSVDKEIIYGDFRHVYHEIHQIGEFHIIDNINIIEAGTKKAIRAINNIDTRNRLVKLCSAIEYNLPINISIDGKTKFSSMDDLLRVLKNINFKFLTLEYDLSYYKDHIRNALDQDLDLDRVIRDYQNAKLVGEIIDDYKSELLDDQELY